MMDEASEELTVLAQVRGDRRCGECTLCCKAIAVVQLAKPTGEWCRHVCDRKCGIYPTRPIECRTFRCLWLNGYFLETDRPDHLGVVFFEETTAEGETIVTVSEHHSGAAAESRRVKAMIRSVLEQGIPVAVRNATSVARANPDGRIARFSIDQGDPLKVNTNPPPNVE